MLERIFKKPGYAFVMLIFVIIYFYGRYKETEIERHKIAILNTYKSYGENILGSIKSGDLGKVQSIFEGEERGKITLEDIATFISTLHLDRIGIVKWSRIKGDDNNISLSGDIFVDKNVSYPVDMMIIKREDKLILKRLVVNGRALRAKEVDFPLDDIFDSNGSEEGKILIKRCTATSLNSENVIQDEAGK